MAKNNSDFVRLRQTWSLLSALQALSAPVSLHMASETGPLQGRILATDALRDTLMLDVPKLKVSSASLPQNCRVEAQIEGRLLEFSCVIERIVGLNDGPAVLAQKPMLLSDRQRRGAFRVRVPAAEALQAAILEGSGVPLQAQLTDISISGFGAAAPARLLVQDGVKVHCKITLPDVAMFVDATVRHHGTNNDLTRIGLQFTEITSVLENVLSQTILKIERTNLRTRDP